MVTKKKSRVLILGSGPAGLTAAVYASRANLEPVLIHGIQPGGQMTITTDVENYPGFAEVIQGPWLMEQMRAQAESVGTEMFSDIVESVDLSKRPWVCVGDSGQVFEGETLIISTGAQARWLGLESEESFKGFGVSACATCDGFFFRGKTVAVVGGGNTAVEEALFLTNFASKVWLIHRRDKLRAEKLLQDRLFANKAVEIIWDHEVEEVVGHSNPKSVTGLRLKSVAGGSRRDVSIDGLFVAIGHTPNTQLFEGQLGMDEEGYIVTAPDTTKTNIPGVFAAGDVQDKIYRQAVTAAGSGCMAALDAEKFLADDGDSTVS
ncbi:MAG: thioredoxin-disulfide reductase [Rhodospirillaceae bacterium]|nr:thioredoxin-disulfide reductase [Rhodospirillaceae bacterium]|tara:strand:+ start:377 stop:1336 length:960 start_codon:yes stop_codon:yes gene_type:complete